MRELVAASACICPPVVDALVVVLVEVPGAPGALGVAVGALIVPVSPLVLPELAMAARNVTAQLVASAFLR